MTPKGQVERVIAASRRACGVSRIDFQLPDIVDGGPPILNFPGRMWDAERQGYSFEVIGKRNRCKIFRLISEPDDVESGAGAPPEGGLPAQTTDVSRPLHGPSLSPALSVGVDVEGGGRPATAPPLPQPAVALSADREGQEEPLQLAMPTGEARMPGHVDVAA